MMLRQIQHFQIIVQENSFTEATELCHISQSGISQSIKALEDGIGVRMRSIHKAWISGVYVRKHIVCFFRLQ